MTRTPSFPLAEHPLDALPRQIECSEPAHSRTYLSQLMLQNSLRQCGSFVKGRVLDVGCGRRPYERTFFSGAGKYIGADYLSDRSWPDVICSAIDLAFADQSFDTVVSTEVLEHVPDPAKAVREMARVLKPDGHLVVSTPLYWPRHEVPYDFFRYPYDGMLYFIKAGGLDLVKLFSRGRSYAAIGQAIQHVQPVPWKSFSWLVNRFFLFCDRRLKHDVLTMGWTFVARKPPAPLN